MRGDSDNRLSADLALMKWEADKYLKKCKVYYIVAKEKLHYFECWRYEIHSVVSHKIRHGEIIAKSAFWGTDEYDAGTSKIFTRKKDAIVYKNRQNCLEVLFNEPDERESVIWKEEFEKWLSDMLPIWR